MTATQITTQLPLFGRTRKFEPGTQANDENSAKNKFGHNIAAFNTSTQYVVSTC